MLKYFEAFRKYDIPERLNNELLDSNDKPLTVIDRLNKVNIVVGANNSGKSILIREILKTRSRSYYSDDMWKEISSCLEFYLDVEEHLKEAAQNRYLASFGETQSGVLISLSDIKQFYNEARRYRTDYDVKNVINHLTSTFDRRFELQYNKIYFLQTSSNARTEFNSRIQANLLTPIFDCLNELKSEATEIIRRLRMLQLPNDSLKTSRIYIPSMRTLRPLANQANIESQIRKEYKFDPDIVINTGQEIPFNIFKNKNSPFESRRTIEVYEKFLSHTFFQSELIHLTFHSEQNILLIKIGNEKDRPIYELGEGLQMIIILTFPFFLYSSGTVAIEEPELYIHPGLQKSFIDFLVNNNVTSNFQIFITTHSNHIIDSVNNSNRISIFSITKKAKTDHELIEDIPDFNLENVAYGNENIMKLLGVTSTSVYLSNCVIWVEGITDKLYFSGYISKYMLQNNILEKYKKFKDYREGINYSFAFSGGDSIVHWDFDDNSEYENVFNKVIVKKFCSKSFVIVDNDFGKNPNRKKLLNNALGERLLILEVPEVENLLSKETIKKVLLTYPTVKKAIKDHGFEDVTDKQIAKYKIGKLIDTVILKKHETVKRFASKSGSLKSGDKHDFCARALPFIEDSDIQPYTSSVIEQILDFILSMNLSIQE